MSIDQAFNGTIGYYDDWMKKALPNYRDVFDTAREILPFPPGERISVLDLGAGTGLFSAHILESYPSAQFVLCDVAEKMLESAKARFHGRQNQFRYILGDYRTADLGGEFDLLISSLSIHHLAGEDKRRIFRRIFSLLKTRGVFVHVDQIRGETGYLRDLYWRHWLEQVERLEGDKQRIRESIERRKTYDRDETLSDQLLWLKEAGFQNVDCVYKNFFIGVFLAMKE